MLVISKAYPMDATQSTQTSPLIDGYNVGRISMQAIAVGSTITGTLQLQYSNDPIQSASMNWSNFPSGGSISISAAGISGLTSGYIDVSYRWMQIVYTKATSAAGATITPQIKTCGF